MFGLRVISGAQLNGWGTGHRSEVQSKPRILGDSRIRGLRFGLVLENGRMGGSVARGFGPGRALL